MTLISLTQLQRASGLPGNWLKSKLKKGVPTGAYLCNGRWNIPVTPNLVSGLRELYRKENLEYPYSAEYTWAEN